MRQKKHAIINLKNKYNTKSTQKKTKARFSHLLRHQTWKQSETILVEWKGWKSKKTEEASKKGKSKRMSYSEKNRANLAASRLPVGPGRQYVTLKPLLLVAANSSKISLSCTLLRRSYVVPLTDEMTPVAQQRITACIFVVKYHRSHTTKITMFLLQDIQRKFEYYVFRVDVFQLL